MISTKFKVGQRVYFNCAIFGRKQYGDVVTPEEAMKHPGRTNSSFVKQVFATWGEGGRVGWMPEEATFTDEPKFKRNLPEWW